MKILLDECLPVVLKKEFSEDDVYTVNELGWSGKSDKEILGLASLGKFDILISVDKGIEKQINIQNYDLAIILLQVPKNTIEFLVPLINTFKNKLMEFEKKKFHLVRHIYKSEKL